MIRKILSIVAIVVLISYSFDIGYEQGYKDRDNKYPDDYY